QVVLARAALVAMALDRDRVLPVLLQPRRLLLQGVLGVGADLVAVVVEEHAVADADLEFLDRPGRRLSGGATAGCRRAMAFRRGLFARRASSEQQSGREGRNDLQVHLDTSYPCREERCQIYALLSDDSHMHKGEPAGVNSAARALALSLLPRNIFTDL